MLPRDYVSFSRTVLAAFFFVSNYAFTGPQGYFDAAAYTKPLLHTWSLSVEGQFYFFLPLILLALSKIQWEIRIRTALWLAALASLGWTIWLAVKAPESGFYYASARAWEFITGAICTTISYQHRRHSKLLLLISGIFLAMSIFFIEGDTHWPNAWTLLPVGFAALFIYLAIDAQTNPLIAHPIFQRIGDMSYSLYLWHWPVWIFARQMFGDQISIPGKTTLLLLTLLLSYLSWRLVEQPFRDRKVVSTKRLMICVAAVLTCAIVFTAFVVASKGYAIRFPDYIARAAVQGLQKTPRGECFRHEDNTHSASEQFCAFGASTHVADATAILWGDSHANQYLTPLTEASHALGRTGLIATMTGCRAFVENDSIQYPDYPYCKIFNREVYAFILAHPEIRTIVLGRFWSDSDETIGRTVLLIKHLIAHGRKVILIGPLPLPGMDVQIAWAMKQVQAGHAINEIKMDRSSQAWLDSTLSKLSSQLKHEMESGDVFLLDPAKSLCDSEYCYIVRDGLSIFGDTSHLTEESAKSFESDFRKGLLWLEPQK